MPKIRPLSFAALFLLLPALAGSQEPANQPGFAMPMAPAKAVPARTAPEVVIDEAIQVMKALPSVSADIKIDADMLNQKFSLAGNYAKAPGFHIAFKLNVVGLGNARGTMVQVCDGVTVWNYTRILENQGCETYRIKPVMEILNKPECEPTVRENILSSLGFVGPDGLLSGLRNAYVFDQVREETVLDGKPVYVFGGSWKNTELVVGPNGMQFNPVGPPLPPYVPSLVTLYLGKTDKWPYQVVFEGRIPAQIERKKDDREVGPDGRPIGRKTTGPGGRPSTVTLTYSNVQLNTTIPPSLFASPLIEFPLPRGMSATDYTEKLVNDVDQAITRMAAMKKAEAAKAAPPLEGALPVPGPAGDGASPLPK